MSETAGELRGRGRTVLVLDDDAAIRKVMRRILNRLDFQVLEAADAQRAFQIADEHPDDIDLVICDLVLPGLGGRDAANAILARAPGTPLLFTSGYSSHSSGRREVKEAGYPFLGKPFDVPEFIQAVADVLEDDGEG